MFSALTGAVISAVTLIIQKFILSTQKVHYKAFNAIVFTFLYLFSLAIYPFFGSIKHDALSLYYLLFLVLMIISGTLWNYLLTVSLQKEKVVEFELIAMTQPLLTILISGLLFVSERNWQVLVIALIASVALIASHFKKDHIYFDKYARYLLWAILLMSLEYVFIKILLNVYSPVALYMVRTFFIALSFWLFMTPAFEGLNLKKIGTMAGVSALAVIQMVLIYTAIETKGLVYTTLFLILSPVLVYIFSMVLFKERIKPRTAICILVIIVCIIYATLIMAK